MNFSPNKTPIEVIKEDALGGAHYGETFILVLMGSGTKIMEIICSFKKY